MTPGSLDKMINHKNQRGITLLQVRRKQPENMIFLRGTVKCLKTPKKTLDIYVLVINEVLASFCAGGTTAFKDEVMVFCREPYFMRFKKLNG